MSDNNVSDVGGERDSELPEIVVNPKKFESTELGNLDLSDEKRLAGRNLAFASCIVTDFSRADLRKTNLSNAELVSARCWQADMRGTVLDNANLRQTQFTGAAFDETTSLAGAWFNYADFTGALLPARIRVASNRAPAVDITDHVNALSPLPRAGISDWTWVVRGGAGTLVQAGNQVLVEHQISDTHGGTALARTFVIVIDNTLATFP